MISCKHHNRAKGFTLIEVLVSLIILVIGAGSVWHTFLTSARLDAINNKHREAISFAQGEVEYLRFLPRALIRDTSYVVSGTFEKRYLVTRTVFDSAKIEETFEEIDVDRSGSPLYLRRPLEIKVEVREVEEEMYTVEEAEKDPVLTLSFLKPDYQWY